MRRGRGGFYRDNKGRALIMPVDGGERVAYDSPSGFGDWIENASSLTRHLNRQTVEGLLAHARTAELSGLEVISGWSKNLDGLTGYERTQQLDRIVELLHEAAKVSRKADRGSHVHAITEDSDSGRDWMARLRDGEDLGMGAEVQQRLVDAYHRLCDSFGLEVIEIEAPCVNDEWQLAGTLDRIARPTRELQIGGLWLQGDQDAVVDIKGLALNTLLPTPSGWTTMGEVKVGDQVIGSDGKPCAVTHKSDVRNRPCYRIRFDDTTEVVADDEHRWAVLLDSGEEVLTTAELQSHLTNGRQRQIRILNPEPIHLPDADLPIEPYIFGLWLGDGTRRTGSISKPVDNDVWNQIRQRGWEVGAMQAKGGDSNSATATVLGLRTQLRHAGLLETKQIPDPYLRGSLQQRLDFLRGLMDSDGTWNKKRRSAMFTTTDRRFAEVVRELVLSLGERSCFKTWTATGFGKEVAAFGVEWTPMVFNPFNEAGKRGRAEVRRAQKNWRRMVKSVELVDSVPTQCIAVDSPDHTYLCTEAMIPTHNTSKMYRSKDGYLRFWQNYPIQIAGYQGSVPYDQESETRGEWERPLSHMTGLIVHLDIDKARVGADNIATLVAVSLSEGRMMGEMCVQARDVARGYEEGGIGAFAIVKPPDLELSADNPSSEPETCVREADSEQVSADSTDIDPLEARKSALRERWRALSDLGKRMYHSANIDPEDLDKADEILTRLEEGWDTHADLKAAGLVE